MKQLLTEQFTNAMKIAKREHYVFEIMFTNGVWREGVNDHYFATAPKSLFRETVADPLPADTRWHICLKGGSLHEVSQDYNPITNLTKEGVITSELINVENIFNKIVADYRAAGFGVRRQICDVYRIYEGDEWGKREQVARMQVEGVTTKGATKSIKLADPLAKARDNTMNLHKAVLATALVPITTTLTIARVEKDTDFPYVRDWSYLAINKEAMKVTSRTLNADGTITFTVLRSQLDTVAPATTDIGAAVEEVVVAKGDAIDVACLLLTGYYIILSGSWVDTAFDIYRAYTAGYPIKRYYPGGGFGKGPIGPFPVRYETVELRVPTGDPAPTTTYIKGGYNYSSYSVELMGTTIVPVWSDTAVPPRLPDHWHAGLDFKHHINYPMWSEVQAILGTTDLTTGNVVANLEFVFTKPIQPKYFVEREILRLIKAKLETQGDGTLGLVILKDPSLDAILNRQSNGDPRLMVLDGALAKSDTLKVVDVNKQDYISKINLHWDVYPRYKGKFLSTAYFENKSALDVDGKGREVDIYASGLRSVHDKAVDAVFVLVAGLLARYSGGGKSITIDALPRTHLWQTGDNVYVDVQASKSEKIQGTFQIIKKTAKNRNTFTLFHQPDTPVIQSFRRQSSYTNSAWLNGLDPAAIPANRNLLLLSPTGSPLVLDGGDYYVPTGYAGSYTMYGTWTTTGGTPRIFGDGEIITDPLSFKFDGKGKSDRFNGYAGNGAVGNNSLVQFWWEEGYWDYWAFSCKRRGKVLSSQTFAIKNPGGIGKAYAGAVDIVSGAKQADGKVAKLLGIPDMLVGSGSGSRGIISGVSPAGQMFRGYQILRDDGYVHMYGNSFTGTDGRTLWEPPQAGGAGIVMCAPRLVLGGEFDLSPADPVAPTSYTIANRNMPRFGCDDRGTVTISMGQGGQGTFGTAAFIAENDPLRSIVRNNLIMKSAYNGIERLI